MIDNIQAAKAHFEEKKKAYKEGLYFVTSDGQIFDDIHHAKDRVASSRNKKLKIFKVENDYKAEVSKPKKSRKKTAKKSEKESTENTFSKVEEKTEDKKEETEESKK